MEVSLICVNISLLSVLRNSSFANIDRTFVSWYFLRISLFCFDENFLVWLQTKTENPTLRRKVSKIEKILKLIKAQKKLLKKFNLIKS